MCGICGFTKSKDVNGKKVIGEMLRELRFRGPDENNYCEFDRVFLGQTRLSIIDVADGHQPMVRDEYTIVFNGEIYNYMEIKADLLKLGYIFSTNSDTEVLLVAYIEWKEKCLEHFIGMFSFAIYDNVKNKIFAAKDRYGKKPFFYYYDKESSRFAFASEVKTLKSYPFISLDIDNKSIADYFQLKYVPAPYTFCKDILKLKAGFYLMYDLTENNLTTKQYYSEKIELEEKLENKKSIDENVSLLDDMLSVSVKRRMVSDVPIGAFLSGGLDSSVIVALMSKYSKKINTFSIGFDMGFDETIFAEQVAKLYDTNHTKVTINADEFIKTWKEVIVLRDNPMSEPADVPLYILAKEAAKSVKVILSGEGSDETFGGYPKYTFDKYAGFYGKLPKVIHNSVDLLPYKFRRIKVANNSMKIQNEVERFISWFAYFTDETRSKILKEDFIKENKSRAVEIFSQYSNKVKGSSLDKMLFLDRKIWLPDNLVERGDRMLMAASIEGRMPFLDEEIINFSNTLPNDFKIKGMNGKYILKKMAEKYLPKDIIYRKKAGFVIPLGDWFRFKTKDFIYDTINYDKVCNDFLNKKGVLALVDDHMNGIRNNEKEIWSIINIILYFNTIK